MSDRIGSVSILIPSRNRCEMLRKTLQRLADLGVRQEDIYVFLDASTDGSSEMLRTTFPKIFKMDSSVNVGLIRARNEMVKRCPSEIILGLDDDSWPLDSNFVDVIQRVFARYPKAAFLAGNVHDSQYPQGTVPQGTGIFPVRNFVGCGFVIRRSRFQELGGFRDFFFYGHEESELCLRSYARGGHVLFVPELKIYHEHSEQNRNRAFTTRSGLCNSMSACVLNEPPWLCMVHLLSLLCKGVLFCIRHHHWATPFLAIKDFVLRLRYLWTRRQPVSSRVILQWYRLRKCPPR